LEDVFCHRPGLIETKDMITTGTEEDTIGAGTMTVTMAGVVNTITGGMTKEGNPRAFSLNKLPFSE
jgi:hypothetical protein